MIEFDSLLKLAEHLQGDEIDQATTDFLAHAEKVLVTEAKAEFGVYQAGAGPFGAWPELAEATKEDRVAKGFTENDPLLRTGGLRDSIVSEKDATSVTVGSEDPVMAYQELGTAKIPPRPVLGIALFKHIDGLVESLGALTYAGIGGATGRMDYSGKKFG